MREDEIICPSCKSIIDADDYFDNYCLYGNDYEYSFKVVCKCNTEIMIKRTIIIEYELE